MQRRSALHFDRVVVGAGVIGLAIASRISRTGASVLLVEKHNFPGFETSSRNSEVIHSGLYYPENSEKSAHCINGKELLYDLCTKNNIPFKRTGKWIVAQSKEGMSYLESLRAKAKRLCIPTEFVSKEMLSQEPLLKCIGALHSPSTGIVDSHSLLKFLEYECLENSVQLAYNTTVEDISSINSGYQLLLRSFQDIFTVNSPIVINSAGLYADKIAQMVIPNFELSLKFVKGHYVRYSGSKQKFPTKLIYPIPQKNLIGLGVHLTFDMSGNVRFGPDAQVVSNPQDYSMTMFDSSQKLDLFYNEIQKYLPSIEKSKLNPDYCGIRPKLDIQNFQDFYIKHEDDRGFPGFVNLIGIESPGLTSCLSIANKVESFIL